jgi:hypothetical protein
MGRDQASLPPTIPNLPSQLNRAELPSYYHDAMRPFLDLSRRLSLSNTFANMPTTVIIDTRDSRQSQALHLLKEDLSHPTLRNVPKRIPREKRHSDMKKEISMRKGLCGQHTWSTSHQGWKSTPGFWESRYCMTARMGL